MIRNKWIEFFFDPGSLKYGKFRFLLLNIGKSYLSLFFYDKIIGPFQLKPIPKTLPVLSLPVLHLVVILEN